jgi:hypothetical protein
MIPAGKPAHATIPAHPHDTVDGMKRIEFEITNEKGESLRGPGFVEECSDLPFAIMEAVKDFIEAHDGRIDLPITIQVKPDRSSPTC